MRRNTWKLCPNLQAVNNKVPLGSKAMAATGSLAWAWKCAKSPSQSESSETENLKNRIKLQFNISFKDLILFSNKKCQQRILGIFMIYRIFLHIIDILNEN